MYMVQVTDITPSGKYRYTGIGKTVELAMREIVLHFQPVGLKITEDQAWVLKQNEHKRFKPVSDMEFSDALSLMAEVYEQLMK